jgi:hypothetical protein
MSEFQFKYNPYDDYKTNFSIWFAENTREKRFFKEKPYTEKEAKKVFRKMYGKYNSFSIGSFAREKTNKIQKIMGFIKDLMKGSFWNKN